METIDWKTIFTIGALLLSVATFYVGRVTANRTDGEKQGALSTDVKYIKESVVRIEATVANESVKTSNETARTNGRIDEISTQLCNIAATASAAKESAVMQHKRMNEHLEREHGLIIEKSKDD